MPTQDDFPKSVVLHFPPSVYQKFGAAEMIPNLLEILHVEDLRCVQFLRNGKVRVSFREKDVCGHYLVEGLRFGDHDIPVTKDGQKVTVLYIRDLPYEVPSDDLVDFFSNYGEVLTVERSVAVNFPGLCNGNRILKLILNEDLPYFFSVCGYQCRVCYRGQPLQCLVCRERGHPEPPVKCVPDKLPVAVPVEFVPDRPPVDVSMTNTTKTRVSDDLAIADPVPVKVLDKPPAADTALVSDKLPVSPTADTASAKVTDKPPMDDDEPMSKPVRSSVTAKVFCIRLSKTIFLFRTLVRLARIGTPKLRLI